MSSQQLVGWGGPAAMLGGLLWIAWAVITALKPEGCIAGECDLPGRSMREGSTVDGVLFIAAVLLIAVGVAEVVIHARRAGGFGRLGSTSLISSIVGTALLMTAFLIQAILFGGDFPYMPLFLVPAGLALILGMLLLGIAILRAAVLPGWAGVLLIIGTLAMLGFNDQNARALIAVPFGIVWLAVGYTLWSGKGEQSLPT